MDASTGRRHLVDGRLRKTGRLSIAKKAIGLSLAGLAAVLCAVHSSPFVNALDYPCGSWDAGMVKQNLHDIDANLENFWNTYAGQYGEPEVLTDSYYKSNQSAYIYPDNLTPYIPVYEPPAGASEDTVKRARNGNACIDNPNGSPYNSFRTKHPNFINDWKTLTNSVGAFTPTSLNMKQANTYYINNDPYCGRRPKPADCTDPYRTGEGAKAYKMFYNVAIFRGGDGDTRDSGITYPEDSFRIWSTPRNPDRSAMSFRQFGDPATIPNNLQNRKGNNGTVVFKNTFEITEDDYNLYQTLDGTSGKGALSMQGIADDYLGMWLNGNPVAYSIKSGNAFMNTVDPKFLKPPSGGKSVNELKMVLFDKYVLQQDRSGYQELSRRSMGSGFLYSMMYFPPKNAQLTVRCGGTTFPSTVPMEKDVRFNVSANFGPGPNRPSISPVLSYEIKKVGGGFVQGGEISYSRDDGATRTTLTSEDITLRAGTLNSHGAGNYQLTWKIISSRLDPNIKTCPATTTTMLAGYQPYFSVRGGDIWSGTSDDTDSAKGIKSWNADGPPYNGAGSHIAALASGKLQSFISGSGLAGGAGSGSGLSFANNPPPGGSGDYGGEFRSLPEISAPAVDDTCRGRGGLSCSYTGRDVRVSGAVEAGKTVVVSPERDVYITGDITYNYNTVDEIPQLFIIAKNIYIDPNVSEIHGTLWANQKIYTCSKYTDDGTADGSPAAGVCDKPLRVYGSVFAKSKLYLLRTGGNWVGNDYDPAEQFIYSPEVWLNGPTSKTVKFDAYVSLPPIL